MKWRYKSEMRVKALIWSVICQQRLSSQFRHEDVHGLILGNSMDLAYQILTSTGGRKHDSSCWMAAMSIFFILPTTIRGR